MKYSPDLGPIHDIRTRFSENGEQYDQLYGSANAAVATTERRSGRRGRLVAAAAGLAAVVAGAVFAMGIASSGEQFTTGPSTTQEQFKPGGFTPGGQMDFDPIDRTLGFSDPVPRG